MKILMAKQILCIEDDTDMRSAIALVLEGAGYQMLQAEDGKRGLEMALKAPPDLIICDIRMPGMDGFATLQELRKHQITAKIPFIFLTGEDPRSQMRKGMNLGANDFIMKPFNVEDLIQAVEVRFKEVKQNKEEAQRAIDELSESITRSLPHELRTPMTGVLGLAELLMSQSQEMTYEEIKDLAQSLYDSAMRMNQTLEKFWIHTQCMLLPHDPIKLAASRQTGSRTAHINIGRVAEELSDMYKRPQELEKHLSPFALAIAEQYLEHIVKQVVDNAFKFSARGTKVKLTTSIMNDRGIVTVIDEGRGLSEDQIHKINSFMQFGRERYEQQGLGLGLMIAQRLTEAHQGTFEVISMEGKGSTVTLSFPLLPVSLDN